MAILVRKFKVRFNNKTYGPGETIIGLPEKDEADLVSKGYADYVIANNLKSQENFENEGTEEKEALDMNKHVEDESVEKINVSLDADELIEVPQPKTQKRSRK